LESIVVNHPFLDGNKRTGYTLMRLTLLQFDMDIDSTQDDKYELVIGVAEGRITFDQIKKWIEGNLKE
jgi:death-on-curing protein